MSPEDAITILTHIEKPIRTVGFSSFDQIKLHVRKYGKPVESKWHNFKHSHNEAFTPPNILEESTYEDCVEVTLHVDPDEKRLWATVVMWDGELWDGTATEERCSWKVQLQEVPTYFVSRIHSAFERYVETLLDREEQIKQLQQRAARMKHLSSTLGLQEHISFDVSDRCKHL